MADKPKRIPHLHEVLAVVPDTTKAADAILAEAKVTFDKKADHFRGMAKSITYLSESRAGENSTDSKEVVDTVMAKLAYVADIVGRNWDAVLQMEDADCRAKADLIVNGVTIAADLPALFLLSMEKKLAAMHAVVMAAPTLDPAISWTPDASKGDDVYRSNNLTTFKQEKLLEHKILVPATDKHPAQVEKWTADVAVARVDTTQYSAMLTPIAKSDILGRIDALLAAVKQARMRANETEVQPMRISDKLFNYILEGWLPA